MTGIIIHNVQRAVTTKAGNSAGNVFGFARRGSTIGFHLLWHTVELAMTARLCLL